MTDIYRIEETIRYDPESGQVQTLVDDVVRHAIEVRKGVEDAVLLPAIVVELERRGYTVVPPPWIASWIDPVGCGCTDCCIGYSRPADSVEQYDAATRAGRSR